jgi:hypothetical protein
MMRRLAALAVVGLVIAACSGPAPSPQAEYDVVAEAIKAFERSDWAQATRLLREAIIKQPTTLRLHYALAIAASHLDLREETIREFQWVLASAPGTTEAEVARNWLIAAGVLRGRDTATAEEQAPPPVDKEIGTSALSGRIVWSGGEPPIKTTRMQLFLRGISDTPTKGIQYVLRTDEEAGFRFKNIAAGPYQLTDRIAGQPLWRLRVEIPPDQDVSLELGPQNSVPARDDFPNEGK